MNQKSEKKAGIATETGTVYFAHCVDTEGPLCEDLTATFERVARMIVVMVNRNKNMPFLRC